MSEQWIRQCKLTVQVDQNKPRALDLSEYHIYFHISQPTTDAPKTAEIYIYNLSKIRMDELCGVDDQKVSGKGLRKIIAMGGSAYNALVKQIQQIRMWQSNEGMTLMDDEDTFETHQYSFSGLDSILLQLGQQLSGALGIPLVRLWS